MYRKTCFVVHVDKIGIEIKMIVEAILEIDIRVERKKLLA